MTLDKRVTAQVLSVSIDVLSWEAALRRLEDWASKHESRYICICNAHSVVTAQNDQAFGRVIAEADMATADGAPVAYMVRRAGHRNQQRINGPDLMWKYCGVAALSGSSIYLYGATSETLEILQTKIKLAFPTLIVAGAHAPPFRPSTLEEDAADVARINASNAGTVWVSLGCPKQEMWMAAHRGQITAVMIGVGAAFDYHAGMIRRAPLWMQRAGLEWFYRLCSEPRRLWRRYLYTNTVFLNGALRQSLLLSLLKILKNKK